MFRVARRRLANGYRFFEDQYPQRSEGTQPSSYQSWEDQMKRSCVVSSESRSRRPATETEKLNQKHDWTGDFNTGKIEVPNNYGWSDSWGPDPTEDGHNKWYDRDTMYMNNEEKIKRQRLIECPLEKDMLRGQRLPLHKRMEAAAHSLLQEAEGIPLDRSFPSGESAGISTAQKVDKMGAVKKAYVDEWLEKDGVTRENCGLEMGRYNGTKPAKQNKLNKVKRAPDWELAPIVD